MLNSFDLHCHSIASDGSLSPSALLKRAQDNNVATLAITDHDTLAGYNWLQEHPVNSSVQLISGVEISCCWRHQEIHILALNFGTANLKVQALLANQQELRRQRGFAIASKLERKGVIDAWQGAKDELVQARFKADNLFALSCKEYLPGRQHFAQYLIKAGMVDTQKKAFSRYLGKGKCAYVCAPWPCLSEIVQILVSLKAIVVLAHPMAYKMTRRKLQCMVEDFVQAGGQGIEVVNSTLVASDRNYLAQVAAQYNLYSSLGSDFHGPDRYPSKLGGLPLLPENCKPIWELF